MQVNDNILTNFHSDEYVELIRQIHPSNKHLYEDQLYRCKNSKEWRKYSSFKFCLSIFKGTKVPSKALKLSNKNFLKK